MRIITTISRILVGLLFIFSGFIKANDPLGFTYKLEEYFVVFDLPVLIPAALILSILICAFEIILGFMLLTGSRKKTTLWLLTLMTLFFTFLTYYSAYYNKVTDCGCFGDFLHLTPWQSFGKDIAILFFLLIIILGHKYINRLLPYYTEIAALLVIAIASFVFPVYTLRYLPVFDFRPYKTGTNILDAMKIPEGAPQGKYETKLYYKNLKTNESKEFNLQNYPWQDTLNWKYDTTVTVVLEKPYQPPIHDFNMINSEGSDYTEDILNSPGKKFFVVCYDLGKTKTSNIEELVDFVQLAKSNKIQVYGLTASVDKIETFLNNTGIGIDFYISDATQLKTFVRANPGIVLLDGPVVKAMWSTAGLPAFNDVLKKY